DITAVLNQTKDAVQAANSIVNFIIARLENISEGLDKMTVSSGDSDVHSILSHVNKTLKELNKLLPLLPDTLAEVEGHSTTHMSNSITRIKDMIKESRDMVNSSQSDYVGMVVRDGVLYCVYKLGGVFHEIETRRIIESRFNSTFMDRVDFRRIVGDTEPYTKLGCKGFCIGNLKKLSRNIIFSYDLHLVCNGMIGEEATQVLVQSLVISKLDYCNLLLAGLPLRAIKPLQLVQNAAAQLVFNLPKFTRYSTAALPSLAPCSCTHQI
ncbi:hypothetical protein P4O66_013134, partial [Electrophorus voltai]